VAFQNDKASRRIPPAQLIGVQLRKPERSEVFVCCTRSWPASLKGPAVR
jgi:hypothetical protein